MAGKGFLGEVIVPDKNFLQSGKMARAIEDSLNAVSEDIIVDFQVTTRTWRTAPMFFIESQPGERYVYTGNKIYGFITHGTRVRRAVMSKDFKAKTRVGQIRSWVGKGGAVFISKKIALPGILARNFDEVIADKWLKRYPKLLQGAINAIVARG